MEKSAVEALECHSVYPEKREKLSQFDSSLIFICKMQVTAGVFVRDF